MSAEHNEKAKKKILAHVHCILQCIGVSSKNGTRCVLRDVAQAQGPQKIIGVPYAVKKEKVPRPDHIQPSARLCHNISDNNVRRILAEFSTKNSFYRKSCKTVFWLTNSTQLRRQFTE